MSEDANITGKGAEILLPPQGNPFKADADSSTPTDVQGKTIVAEAPSAADGVGGTEEPTDLSPEDIAAMFPASQEERNKVPLAAEPPPLVLTPDEAAPAALTPEQISGMLADNIGPATHEGARPEMAIHNGGSGRPSQPGANRINLNEFNPDTPVGGSASYRSKAPIMGKVDFTGFDPDAAITEAAPVDSGTINTDAPPPADPGQTFTPDPDLSAPSAGSAPASLPNSVVLTASQSDGASTPGASVTINTPSPAPDPFAGLPPTPPAPVLDGVAGPAVDAPVVVTPVSPPEANPAAGNQAAVTVTAGGSTMTASVSAPNVSLDDSNDGGDSHSDPSDLLPSVPPISLPVAPDTALVDMLITDDRIMALWQRIDRVEMQAVADENSLPVQRTKNFENLKAARNLLLGGRQNYEDTLRYVNEVEANLAYIKRIRRWSSSWGIFLLVYTVAWLILLAFGYLSAVRLADQFASTGVFDKQFGFALWVTMLSGGLGGVSKSLFSLASHIIKQDFDIQHNIWYYTSPLIGSIMGIFVFLFSQVGLNAASAGSSTGSGTIGYAVFILAWMIGFQQNLLLLLLAKVVSAIFPNQESKDS